MPIAALLQLLLPELVQLGIQEAPIIRAYIASLSKLSDPSRQDIDDATRDAIRAVIVDLQAQIDAMPMGDGS